MAYDECWTIHVPRGALSVASIVHFCFSISIFTQISWVSSRFTRGKQHWPGRDCWLHAKPLCKGIPFHGLIVIAEVSYLYISIIYMNTLQKWLLQTHATLTWNPSPVLKQDVQHMQQGEGHHETLPEMWLVSSYSMYTEWNIHGRNGFRNMSQVFRLLKQTLILKNHWT